MKFSYATLPFENDRPAPSEITSLAEKFHSDANCARGRDQDYRLCAEYMLAQKELIQYRLHALHRRKV